MSISKQFEKKMLKQMKRIFDYNLKIKVKVTRPFKQYKTTIQGEITVTSNTIYLDSLFTPFLKHIMKIHSYNGNLVFDIVTTEYKFNEED